MEYIEKLEKNLICEYGLTKEVAKLIISRAATRERNINGGEINLESLTNTVYKIAFGMFNDNKKRKK